MSINHGPLFNLIILLKKNINLKNDFNIKKLEKKKEAELQVKLFKYLDL